MKITFESYDKIVSIETPNDDLTIDEVHDMWRIVIGDFGGAAAQFYAPIEQWDDEIGNWGDAETNAETI